MGLGKRAYQDVGWKTRRIDGYGDMTCLQFYVLREMVRCKESGWPFIDLAAIDSRTVLALENKGYIFASKGKDGLKHSVTRRGEKALKVFGLPVTKQRRDGICPQCGAAPRGRTRSGYFRSHCNACMRENARRQRAAGVMYGDPNNPGMCPRCQQRRRQVWRSGRIDTYCKACKMAMQFSRQV